MKNNIYAERAIIDTRPTGFKPDDGFIAEATITFRSVGKDSARVLFDWLTKQGYIFGKGPIFSLDNDSDGGK